MKYISKVVNMQKDNALTFISNLILIKFNVQYNIFSEYGFSWLNKVNE